MLHAIGSSKRREIQSALSDGEALLLYKLSGAASPARLVVVKKKELHSVSLVASSELSDCAQALHDAQTNVTATDD